MPTFRNGGERTVVYKGIVQPPNEKSREILVFFDAGKDTALDFWIPYEELGLELVNADEPPIPNTILLSGTFKFDEGTERKFSLDHCDTYILNVIIQSGKVKVYPGNSAIGAEITINENVPYHYTGIYDWEYAPYLRVVGLEDNTNATIHAEVYKASRSFNGVIR